MYQGLQNTVSQDMKGTPGITWALRLELALTLSLDAPIFSHNKSYQLGFPLPAEIIPFFLPITFLLSL